MLLLDLCQHAKVQTVKLLSGFFCTEQAASDTKNCAVPWCRMLLIFCSCNVKPLQIAHSTVVIVQIRVCKKNPAHRIFLCQRKVRRFGRTQPDHRFDCLIHCVAELHGDCPSLVQALYSDRKKWHCQFAKGFWVLSRGQRMRRLDGWWLQGSLQVAPSKLGTSSHTSRLAMRSEKVRYWHCMARFETALQSNGWHSDGSQSFWEAHFRPCVLFGPNLVPQTLCIEEWHGFENSESHFKTMSKSFQIVMSHPRDCSGKSLSSHAAAILDLAIL